MSNLFENLQLMHESENPIISEFKEFLASKNAQYIYNELGETKDGMQIVIYGGDWKHEHLYMKNLINEFFKQKGMNISIRSEEIGESEQDTYSAKYDIKFNAKPDTLNLMLNQKYIQPMKDKLKFTTESIRYQVICQLAISNGEVYSEHSNLKDAIDSARKAKQSFMNVEIKDLKDGNRWYNIDDAEQDLKDGLIKESNEIFKDIDTSNWKQRFKGMDIYASDKYPDYQIKKSYTSSKQEVWQVLNFKTGREVFASGTFNGAIEWVENKSTSKKSEALNNFEESIENDINLDEYKYIGPATGYNKGWSLYRKIVDGKSVWVGEHQQTKEVVSINYNQVQGFEPIKNIGVDKLRKNLGDVLLPKRESNN